MSEAVPRYFDLAVSPGALLDGGAQVGDILQWDGAAWIPGPVSLPLSFADIGLLDPTAPVNATTGKLYKKQGSTGLWWRTSTTLVDLTTGGGGGGAANLQDAYDGGNNILLAANTPIAIRKSGTPYDRVPILGMLVDGSTDTFSIPFAAFLDKNAGTSSFESYNEISDEFAITLTSPTDINVAASPLPAWAVAGWPGGLPIIVIIKNADVPADNGMYTVVNIVGDDLTLFDVSVFAPANLSFTTANALILIRGTLLGGSNNQLLVHLHSGLSNGCGVEMVSHDGNVTSEAFIRLTNGSGSVLTEGMINLRNLEATYDRPIIDVSLQLGGGPELQFFARSGDATSYNPGSLWYNNNTSKFRYADAGNVVHDLGGSGGITTVGTGGDYPTITDAVAASVTLMRLISDITEPGTNFSVNVDNTTIIMNGYSSDFGDGTMIMFPNQTMNLIGPGTLITTRTTNGSGIIIGDGGTQNEHLYANGIHFINTQSTNNFFTYLIPHCYDCKFTLCDTFGGGFYVHAFDRLGEHGTFARCEFIGAGTNCSLAISTPPDDLAITDCILSGTFIQTEGATDATGTSGVMFYNVKVSNLTINSTNFYIRASYVDTIFNPNGYEFSIITEDIAVNPYYRNIDANYGATMNMGRINLNGISNATVDNCKLRGLLTTLCSNIRVVDTLISRTNMVAYSIDGTDSVYINCQFERPGAAFQDIINTTRFTSCLFDRSDPTALVAVTNTCTFDQCTFAHVQLSGPDIRISNSTVDGDMTILGKRCKVMGSWIKGSDTPGSGGIVVTETQVSITSCTVGTVGGAHNTVRGLVDTIFDSSYSNIVPVNTTTGNLIF